MANTIISYTHNINNIPILTSLFAFIACKHCGMQILPHQYTMIHDNMIASIKEVLKDEIPQELVDAMSRAIRHMEKILVGAEESMYQAAEKRSGGFRGWKNFVIQKITQEATNIKTFRIVPEDPSSVNGPFAFTAGQYLTISLPNEPPRHYTVTSPPNVDYLEFTVKLLDHGIISNALHGMTEGHVIKVSPPFGLYTIEDNNKHGVVLISAGIGATPMKAFLQHIGEKCRKLVHIDKCQATVPFYDFFEENNAGKNSFYYTMEGRPDLGEVVNTLVDEVGIEPLFYVCGPPPFMQSIAKLLHIKGVTMERIKWEAFGPQISCPMMS
jgi:nitric oxide dioxygenase